ncbi:MAG: OmpA family protein, partial [Polyangiaceae bacterium]|nr:OmpA family protein [Polyangiaceae bacterium]
MKRHKHPEHINHERWLVSYADFITLLFAFFVVMFAVSRVDTKQLGRFSESFQQAVGLFDGHSNALLPDAGNGIVEAAQGVNAEGNKEVNEVQEALARQQQENPGEALARAKVMRRRNELVLRLDDNIVFDSGDDRVREQAAKALRAVANLVKNRKVELRVEGHTDNIPVRNGRFRSNWELSTARATAVIAELAQAGLAPERLSAAGYGEFHPVGPNDSPEARSKNRRVDLVISGLSTPAPELPATAAPAQPAASASSPAAGHAAAPGQHGAPAGQHDAAAGQHGAPAGQHDAAAGQHGAPAGQHDAAAGQHG